MQPNGLQCENTPDNSYIQEEKIKIGVEWDGIPVGISLMEVAWKTKNSESL